MYLPTGDNQVISEYNPLKICEMMATDEHSFELWTHAFGTVITALDTISKNNRKYASMYLIYMFCLIGRRRPGVVSAFSFVNLITYDVIVFLLTDLPAWKVLCMLRIDNDFICMMAVLFVRHESFKISPPLIVCHNDFYYFY